MIIALLVIMFIILVVLYNVIEKIISVEKKIGELEANAEAERVFAKFDTEFNADAISQLEIHVKKIFNDLRLMNDMDVTLLDKINDLEKTVEELEDDEIKTGTMPKSCNIDGKCNYMDKFTDVK